MVRYSNVSLIFREPFESLVEEITNEEGFDCSKLFIGSLEKVPGEGHGMLTQIYGKINLVNDPREKCIIKPIIVSQFRSVLYYDVINKTIIESSNGFGSSPICRKAGVLVKDTEPLLNYMPRRVSMEMLMKFTDQINSYDIGKVKEKKKE